MKEETQNWVAIAEMDLAAAEVLLERDLYSPVVFHCQQAVEKLLKAIWVETREEAPPRTHNLVDLTNDLALPLVEWPPFLRDLTSQGIASRYFGRQTYPREAAEDYYRRTTELCAQLRHQLS